MLGAYDTYVSMEPNLNCTFYFIHYILTFYILCVGVKKIKLCKVTPIENIVNISIFLCYIPTQD